MHYFNAIHCDVRDSVRQYCNAKKRLFIFIFTLRVEETLKQALKKKIKTFRETPRFAPLKTPTRSVHASYVEFLQLLATLTIALCASEQSAHLLVSSLNCPCFVVHTFVGF